MADLIRNPARLVEAINHIFASFQVPEGLEVVYQNLDKKIDAFAALAKDRQGQIKSEMARIKEKVEEGYSPDADEAQLKKDYVLSDEERAAFIARETAIIKQLKKEISKIVSQKSPVAADEKAIGKVGRRTQKYPHKFLIGEDPKFFIDLFVFSPGSSTPDHTHNAPCLSLQVLGELEEIIFSAMGLKKILAHHAKDVGNATLVTRYDPDNDNHTITNKSDEVAATLHIYLSRLLNGELGIIEPNSTGIGTAKTAVDKVTAAPPFNGNWEKRFEQYAGGKGIKRLNDGKEEKEKKVVALIGSGPMSLMQAIEFVRHKPADDKLSEPVRLVVISKEPKEKWGWGDVSNTVHKEVIFNVVAAKMSLDPGNEKELVDHLKEMGLDTADIETIKKLNSADKLEDQYVPRYLLQGLSKKLVKKFEALALQQGIDFEFVHAEALEVDDEEKKPGSQTKIKIKEPSGLESTIMADVAAITIGLPKSELPGEKFLSTPLFAKNTHNPPAGNILHPDFNIAGVAAGYNVGIAGTKLTAVDALVVLDARGYFKEPGRKVTFFSPSGEFPYPHEANNSNQDGSYKNNSLLADDKVPNKFRKPATAKDLADSILLTSVYATGARYDRESNGIIANPEYALPGNVLDRASKLLRLLKQDDAEYLRDKFSAPRRGYGWQQAIDNDFRPRINDVWKRFDAKEKVTWVSDYSEIYSKLRHRVPYNAHQLIEGLKAAGQIEIVKGRISSVGEELPEQAAEAIVAAPNIIKVSYNDNNAAREVDQMVKATGWEMKDLIKQYPFLRDSRLNGMLHRDRRTDMGVVVAPENAHNLAIIGQLLVPTEFIEMTGFQQLRGLAKDYGAPKLWEMLERQVEVQKEAGQSKDFVHRADKNGAGQAIAW